MITLLGVVGCRSTPVAGGGATSVESASRLWVTTEGTGWTLRPVADLP